MLARGVAGGSVDLGDAVKPPKPKPMKPIKFWAIVDCDGLLVSIQQFRTRAKARKAMELYGDPGDRVTRVLITEAPHGR